MSDQQQQVNRLKEGKTIYSSSSSDSFKLQAQKTKNLPSNKTPNLNLLTRQPQQDISLQLFRKQNKKMKKLKKRIGKDNSQKFMGSLQHIKSEAGIINEEEDLLICTDSHLSDQQFWRKRAEQKDYLFELVDKKMQQISSEQEQSGSSLSNQSEEMVSQNDEPNPDDDNHLGSKKVLQMVKQSLRRSKKIKIEKSKKSKNNLRGFRLPPLQLMVEGKYTYQPLRPCDFKEYFEKHQDDFEEFEEFEQEKPKPVRSYTLKQSKKARDIN